MDQERRTFLRQMAATCAMAVAQKFRVIAALVAGTTAGAAAPAAAAVTTPAAASAGAAAAAAARTFAPEVRGQVFEVVVRQAIAGAPWREICAGPLQVNNIDPEDIEKEVQRRISIIHDSKSATCNCVVCVQEQLRKSIESRLKHERELR